MRTSFGLRRRSNTIYQYINISMYQREVDADRQIPLDVLTHIQEAKHLSKQQLRKLGYGQLSLWT